MSLIHADSGSPWAGTTFRKFEYWLESKLNIHNSIPAFVSQSCSSYSCWMMSGSTVERNTLTDFLEDNVKPVFACCTDIVLNERASITLWEGECFVQTARIWGSAGIFHSFLIYFNKQKYNSFNFWTSTEASYWHHLVHATEKIMKLWWDIQNGETTRQSDSCVSRTWSHLLLHRFQYVARMNDEQARAKVFATSCDKMD